jgi:hypothetical protein
VLTPIVSYVHGLASCLSIPNTRGSSHTVTKASRGRRDIQSRTLTVLRAGQHTPASDGRSGPILEYLYTRLYVIGKREDSLKNLRVSRIYLTPRFLRAPRRPYAAPTLLYSHPLTSRTQRTHTRTTGSHLFQQLYCYSCQLTCHLLIRRRLRNSSMPPYSLVANARAHCWTFWVSCAMCDWTKGFISSAFAVLIISSSPWITVPSAQRAR